MRRDTPVNIHAKGGCVATLVTARLAFGFVASCLPWELGHVAMDAAVDIGQRVSTLNAVIGSRLGVLSRRGRVYQRLADKERLRNLFKRILINCAVDNRFFILRLRAVN